MSNENPVLVFLNGHGDKMAVWGHKDDVIIDAENINIANEKCKTICIQQKTE